jgi:hypothetical protein
VTDTNVVKLAQPGTFADSLTEILRDGARALLTQAVEMEVANWGDIPISRPSRATSASCVTSRRPTAPTHAAILDAAAGMSCVLMITGQAHEGIRRTAWVAQALSLPVRACLFPARST